MVSIMLSAVAQNLSLSKDRIKGLDKVIVDLETVMLCIVLISQVILY